MDDLELSEEEEIRDPDQDAEDKIGMQNDKFWELREEAISKRR